MISIVLYGRNDNYGYNLHKRAALSFNCMAELLSDENDEILFVDYNTPDDFPTFPEAIQDTLTPLAKKRLRILRVRPPIHKRFAGRTRLVALEPVSRNVAVRRSNPANRWILSTNTDMVFVPRGEWSSLSDIVRDLPPGFYHAPRLEVPETLWEGLDRQKPQLAIDTIKDWGSTLHLNEIVLGAKTILYDGPGDFQLIERSDLFKYHGFDEEMILGWHVDSNIAKRLYLVYGKVGDLGEVVFGYHCDHTRQITPAHSHTRTENDWRRFVENLTDPHAPAQADTWGCADDEIEEIRLSEDNSATYVAALRGAIGSPLQSIPVVSYTTESYGTIDYDPRHLLPFLADLFVSAPRNSVIGWIGSRRDTLNMFAEVLRNLGFTESVLVDTKLATRYRLEGLVGVAFVSREILHARASAFVIDFGGLINAGPGPHIGGLKSSDEKVIARAFLDVTDAERLRWKQRLEPRRIACLNAVHTPYEALARSHIGAGLTPFATRMRHGFALPPMVESEDWTLQLQVGAAAERDGRAIAVRPGEVGVVCYGPYRALFSGRYRLVFELAGVAEASADPFRPVGVIEVIWGNYGINFGLIRHADLAAGRAEVQIEVNDGFDPTGVLQTLVRCLTPSTLVLKSLHCEEIVGVSELPKVIDFVGLLSVGPAGEWAPHQQIRICQGKRGFVAYGPYWTFVAGRYELSVEFQADATEGRPFVILEVFSDGHFRAAAFVNSPGKRQTECRLHFEVHEDESPTGEIPVEVRVRSTGPGGLIEGIKIQRVGDPTQQTPWIDFPNPPSNWPLREQDYAVTVQSGGRTIGSVLRAVKRRLLPTAPNPS